MKIRSMVRASIFLSLFILTASYTSVANAAQGCGHGWHQAGFGRCVPNHHRYYARHAYHHPACWRNAWGRLRCHRR